MHKNMFLILITLILLCNGCTATDVSENVYLIGHTVGVMHIRSDDQSTSWTSGIHTETYYEGIITDAWYDFVLVKYNNNESEWVNKSAIRKLLDDPRV